MKNRLDIITVTKNDLPGLARTAKSLKSLILQGAVDWLVVDGGTFEQDIQDVRKIVQMNSGSLIESKLGIFQSMNKGLSTTSNPLVLFLNSGDAVFSNSSIERVLESFQEEKWDWAIAHADSVSPAGQLLWKWPIPHKSGLMLKLGLLSFCHQATFYNRSKSNLFFPFDEESIFADWILSVRFSRESLPRRLEFKTTEYLVGGLSSKVSPLQWASESSRLRIKYGIPLFGSNFFDRGTVGIMSRIWKGHRLWRQLLISKTL
jgi:hypothetical protein